MRTHWHSPSSNKNLVQATTKLQRAWISLLTSLFGYILSALLHMAHRQDEVAKNGDDILKLLELVSIEVGVKSGAMSKDALKSEVARKKKNLDKLNAVRESSQRTSARRLNNSTSLRPAPYRLWNTVANRPCRTPSHFSILEGGLTRPATPASAS
ncbi:unnamed protein product [Ectocarpus sp. 13 AM-2016]